MPIQADTRLRDHRPPHSAGPGIGKVQPSLFAEAIFFIFSILAIGVLEPQFEFTEFNDLTVQQAISEFSTSHWINYFSWVPLAGLASLLVLRHPDRLRDVAYFSWPGALLLGDCLVCS